MVTTIAAPAKTEAFLVTEGAVKSTLQQLFQKSHVRTRSQLVRIALEGSLATDLSTK